mmetsp:Transcript_8843/g.15567  ORF Transcript_8843/g.15567 Transcript_8843/m.15567 type:complete len:410 (+) Transcript_8843:260-1489(+)
MGQDSSRPAAADERVDVVAEPGSLEPMALPVDELETPSLCVDVDVLEANEAKLVTIMEGSGMTVRPHVKSHKSPYFARRQLQSPVVTGLSCATVDEVDAVVRYARARDVLLTNQVVSEAKLDALIDLCVEFGSPSGNCGSVSDPDHLQLLVCVDKISSAELLASRAVARHVVVGCLVEINVGQDRCGVDTVEEAVQLAQAVSETPGLLFRGIQGYQGALQHVRAEEERLEACSKVANKLKEALAAFEHAGFGGDMIVTGGGTGTFPHDKSLGVLTEVQPGSYLFMDCDYSANELRLFEPSLFLLSTVISTSKDRFVLDAGIKSHAIDSGLPELISPPVSKFTLRNGGDEHLVVDCPEGHSVSVGAKMRLRVGHVDPTFNLHSHVNLCHGPDVFGRAKIMRGFRRRILRR